MSIVDLSVAKAKKKIDNIKTLDALHELRTQEVTNMNFPSGRKGVLQALEEKRLELLDDWRKSQVSNRKVPIAMVGNLIDDYGNKIPNGQVVTGISKSKLDFFIKIGGVEYREPSA